jgi:hypothetical protein
MPRLRATKPPTEKTSGKHTGLRHRLTGAPYRVTTAKGQRDFLDAGCTLDEKGNLTVMRLVANEEPTTLVVYASGAWDSFELIVNVVSESKTPAE